MDVQLHGPDSALTGPPLNTGQPQAVTVNTTGPASCSA
jgi:hypothetical protein